LPTLSALARVAAPPRPPGATAMPFETVAKKLRSDLDRAAQNATPGAARELASLGLILDDVRFCERLVRASAAAEPLKGLSELAREYARVSLQTNWGDGVTADLMTERAAEI